MLLLIHSCRHYRTTVYVYTLPQVYHSYFTPLEFTVSKRGDNTCYAKVICNKADNVRMCVCIIGLASFS